MSDMPTMQDIASRQESVLESLGQAWSESLAPIFAAARRGVNADATIAAWKREELEWHDRHDKDRIRLGESEAALQAALLRAEKAEAALKHDILNSICEHMPDVPYGDLPGEVAALRAQLAARVLAEIGEKG